MELNYVALGNRARQLRKERGLSQEQLAERVGISVPHLSNIEKGNTKFSLPVLLKLAEALDVTPGTLLADQVRNVEQVKRKRYEQIDRELVGCKPAQLTMLEDVVRNTKKLLKQYDEKMKEK